MKTVEVHVADKQDVRHLSEVQLARMGVRMVAERDFALQCVTCGEIWEPDIDSSGKLSYGYWICPAKCNQ